MAKVLLVDDDVDLLEMNTAVMAQEGFDVTVAHNTAEARDQLKDGLPDIMVLDVMMETKNAGFNFAREIHQKHPKLPILMLTGVLEDAGVKFKLQPEEAWLPVTTFMEKPVEPDALLAKVKEILKDKK